MLSSARGSRRERQIVVDVAQLVGPLVSVYIVYDLTLVVDLDCLVDTDVKFVFFKIRTSLVKFEFYLNFGLCFLSLNKFTLLSLF